MTDFPKADSPADVAVRDWIARRFVAFGEDLGLVLLQLGFAPAQAQLIARLLVGEVVEAGSKGAALIGDAEAAKHRPPPPAMPSGGQIALVLRGAQVSSWIKDRAGRIEARVRLGDLSAHQATLLGGALAEADTIAGDRPIFEPGGTTLPLKDVDHGLFLDAPPMNGEFSGIKPGELRCLFLIHSDRHTSSLARDGVVQFRFGAAVPVDRRLVGITKSVAKVERPQPTLQIPRVDRLV